MELIDAPLIRLLALPLLASGILAGVVRLVAGPDAGRKLMAAAPAVVFLWIAAMELGMPAFPPPMGAESLSYAIVVALVAAIAVDLLTERGEALGRAYHVALLLAFGAAAAGWLAGGVGLVPIVAFGLWCAMAFRTWRQAAGTAAGAVMLAVAAAGLAILAVIAGADATRDLAVALAAALAGLAVIGWPVRAAAGMTAPAAGLALPLAAGAAFLALLLRLAAEAPEAIAAAVVLGFVFFADSAAKRLIQRPALLSPRLWPLTVAGVAALPVVLAAALLLILLSLPA